MENSLTRQFLTGVEPRFLALEAQLKGALAKTPAIPHVTSAPIDRKLVRAGSKNLLSRAAYGEKDDLKRIKGVATVLEGMLNGIGVFYFWQIAEWNKRDIAHADAQLQAFKGRIERDDWVIQATEFSKETGTAFPPGMDAKNGQDSRLSREGLYS